MDEERQREKAHNEYRCDYTIKLGYLWCILALLLLCRSTIFSGALQVTRIEKSSAFIGDGLFVHALDYRIENDTDDPRAGQLLPRFLLIYS